MQSRGSDGVHAMARTVSWTFRASKLETRIEGNCRSSKSKLMLSGSALAVASRPADPPAISMFLRGQAMTNGGDRISSSGVYAWDQPRPGS